MTEADQTANDSFLTNRLNRVIAAARRLIENKLRLLRNTDQPVLSYVWRAWLVVFIPSVVIGIIVNAVLQALRYEVPPLDLSLTFFFIVGVLIAPWVETVLMGWGLALLKRIFRKTFWICLASAVIWGLLHAQAAQGWGLPAAWAFFIMSLCFLEWEKKSRSEAIKVTALIHMCQNGLAFTLMVIVLVLGVETPQAKKTPAYFPTQGKGGPTSLVTKPPTIASLPAAHDIAEGSEEAKRKAFRRFFPQFGLEEYMLANEDLYPDWKKNLAPSGTWKEFLPVYREFVRYRNASGSPPEAEYSLGKKFLTEKKKASPQERYEEFQLAFPEFGKDEFAFANADLYPHWKGTISPNGSWEEFLPVYKDFIQWWRNKQL